MVAGPTARQTRTLTRKLRPKIVMTTSHTGHMIQSGNDISPNDRECRGTGKEIQERLIHAFLIRYCNIPTGGFKKEEEEEERKLSIQFRFIIIFLTFQYNTHSRTFLYRHPIKELLCPF